MSNAKMQRKTDIKIDRTVKKIAKAGPNAANLRLGKRASAGPSKQALNARNILSPPATEYASALANPFDGPLATIPDFPALPSRRLRVWSKGFFSTGTSQFGFVQFDPYASAANTLSCVSSSDATYAGSTSALSGAGVQVSTSNSDYTDTDFSELDGRYVQGRIVGAGLRIRYSSTELNRGGVVVGATTPNHNSMNGYSFSQMSQFDCATRFRPKQGWINVQYCPALNEELQYSGNLGSRGGAFNPPAGYVPQPIMGFQVQAPSAASPVSFEYEAFCVFEVQGSIVRGLTPSYSDPNGHAAVTTAAQLSLMRPHENDSKSHAANFVKLAGHVAAATLTGIAAHPDAGKNLSWMATTAGSVLGGLLMLL